MNRTMVVMDRRIRGLGSYGLGQIESFIRVGVIDPSGRPVEGIRVEAFGPGARKVGEGKTGVRGAVTISTDEAKGSDIIVNFLLPEGTKSLSVKTVESLDSPAAFIRSETSVEPFLTASEGLLTLFGIVISGAAIAAREATPGLALFGGSVGATAIGVTLFSILSRQAR